MSMGFADLIKLSEYDFLSCKAMEEHFPDEFAVRAALYHLQQAVERLLKATILFNGEHPEFTHDIDKLAEHCKTFGNNYSEDLDLIADSLTMWESKSRYDPYISFSAKKYEMAKKVYGEIRTSLMQQIENAEEEPEDTEELE